MLVGQQGNGELAAGVLQAWQRDFALERPFVAMTLDAGADSARKDQLTSQICVANRRTAFGGNADDAFTDDQCALPSAPLIVRVPLSFPDADRRRMADALA